MIRHLGIFAAIGTSLFLCVACSFRGSESSGANQTEGNVIYVKIPDRSVFPLTDGEIQRRVQEALINGELIKAQESISPDDRLRADEEISLDIVAESNNRVLIFIVPKVTRGNGRRLKYLAYMDPSGKFDGIISAVGVLQP